MNSCDCNASLWNEIEKVLADDDEGLSKATHEIHLTLLNIDLRANWFMNTVNLNHSEFTKLKKKILDSLNEYQQKTMTMKVLLVNLKNTDKELWDQMRDKDVEVEQLNTKLISKKEAHDIYLTLLNIDIRGNWFLNIVLAGSFGVSQRWCIQKLDK